MTTTNINQQIPAFNKDVTNWGKRVRNQAISNAKRLKKTSSKLIMATHESLSDSIKQNIYKHNGEIDCIGYSFARHGVFWQKGVGRGYVMQNGIVIRGHKKKIGINRHDKRTSFVSASGPIKHKPVDWFNTMIDQEIGILADIVAEHYADRVINATRMTIR